MQRFFRLLLSAAFLFGLILPLQAQTFRVHGTVAEAEDSLTSLPLCTVRLLHPRDSVSFFNATTDNGGRFFLVPPMAGSYRVRFTFLGYAPVERRISVSDEHPTVDLGRIFMRSLSHRLKEAEVTALSRQLTIRADTFIYHTSAFDVPAGATLGALIKQMPGLRMERNGKLTFQGKEVSNILINGKEFFGDNETALSNLPAEAVQDVKVYDKTAEDKAFTGSVDNAKATVVDLAIKKSWLGAWNVNLQAGGGTKDRYNLRGFASNFSDRVRAAAYASVNNISENQEADENGNWFNYNPLNGLATFRKAGVVLSADNGRQDNAPGAVKGRLNVTLKHDDNTNDGRADYSTLLPDFTSQFAYGRTRTVTHTQGLSVYSNLKWVTDSMNYVEAWLTLFYDRQRSDFTQKSSTFTAPDEADDAYMKLTLADPSVADRATGIYGVDNASISAWHNLNYNGSISHVRRFRRPGYSLRTAFNFGGNSNTGDTDWLTYYRYFRPDAPQKDLLNRQLDASRANSQTYQVRSTYEGPIAGPVRINMEYRFTHARSHDARNLWQLDRADGFADMGVPVGVRPILSPELLNAANSYDGTNFSNEHSLSAGANASLKKFEFTAGARAYAKRLNLRYGRNGITYRPARTDRGVEPSLYAMFNGWQNAQIRFSYSNTTQQTSLLDLLPITDDANQMSVRVNNPALKRASSHSATLYMNRFDMGHGHSYSAFVMLNSTRNAQTWASQIDARTGKTVMTRVNVNGNYNLQLRGEIALALDSARHWNLSFSPKIVNKRDVNYVGAIGDERGLSRQHALTTHLETRATYRNGIWSVTAGGTWHTDFNRYREAPSANETGHQYVLALSPQVELPFGMKVFTDISMNGSFNYASALLNHTQWVWNASIEQSFLKSRALTLRLQGMDILHQRTAEYALVSATGRSYFRVKCYPSYWMLHLIYRFNTKKAPAPAPVYDVVG